MAPTDWTEVVTGITIVSFNDRAASLRCAARCPKTCTYPTTAHLPSDPYHLAIAFRSNVVVAVVAVLDVSSQIVDCATPKESGG